MSEHELFVVLQCVEDYLKAQEDLGAALKDGFFSIARGKYALGQQLGEQRYPGDMQATTLVDFVRDPHDDVMYDGFQLKQLLLKRPGQHVSNPISHQPAGSVQHNERAPVQPGTAQTGCSQQDPVSWFASLPPPPVKQAQQDFSRALQHAIAAANVLQRLRQLASTLEPPSPPSDAASDDAG
jgi:hypothetical protein